MTKSRLITRRRITAGQRNHAQSRPKGNHAVITLITPTPESAGQRNHAAIHGIHAHANHVSPHPFKGGETVGREALFTAVNNPAAEAS